MPAIDKISLKWLEEAQARVNADRGFRKRGSIDAQVGVACGSDTFLVSFDAFACQRVRAIDKGDLRDADFVLEMSPDRWERFLTDRRAGDGRTLLELDTTDGIVHAANPRKRLEFLRVHTSVQAFFDAGVGRSSPAREPAAY